MSRHLMAFGSLAVLCLSAAGAQAANGCGAGLHLNANGRCVPNRAVVVAPAAGAAVVTGAPVATGAVAGAPAAGVVVAKRCPVHYHLNVNGVCRHN